MDKADTFKGIIVFVLLSCLLVDPMVGNFTWLHYKKIMVQKEVKRHIIQGMDKDNLVLLKFSKQETQTKLIWSHPGEFEYNRKMYDIVETKTMGNTVYYWCWYDHEETMLKRQLEEVADRALGKSPKFKKEIAPLIPYFKTLYCLFYSHGNISIPQVWYKQVGLSYHLYSQILIQPPTPPPQIS
jgi:hypothetical protein